MCVMQDAFVDLERVFLRHGKEELVREMRVAFHEATRGEIEKLVEESAAAGVTASTLEVSFDPEAVTATFRVEPSLHGRRALLGAALRLRPALRRGGLLGALALALVVLALDLP